MKTWVMFTSITLYYIIIIIIMIISSYILLECKIKHINLILNVIIILQ